MIQTSSKFFFRFKRQEDVYPRVTNRIVSPSKSDRHVMFMAVIEQRNHLVWLYHSIDDDL